MTLWLGKVFGTGQVLGVREEPRMREQDFGNYQDGGMRELKKQRARFGRFFFRFSNGELWPGRYCFIQRTSNPRLLS